LSDAGARDAVAAAGPAIGSTRARGPDRPASNREPARVGAGETPERFRPSRPVVVCGSNGAWTNVRPRLPHLDYWVLDPMRRYVPGKSLSLVGPSPGLEGTA